MYNTKNLLKSGFGLNIAQERELVSVILPAYNEKENLLLLVPAIAKSLSGHKIEILVVDDNSPDGTFQALVNLKAQIDCLEIIVRTKDKGFAHSIRDGLLAAKGDILIVMDSDGNHDPVYLPFMVDNLRYFDCVTASRFQYGGGMGVRNRQVLSWIFNLFVRLCTSGMITDSLYGYWAVKRQKLELIKFEDVFWGYGDYCIRLFYYFQNHKLNVLQFPAQNGERLHGEGNSRMVKVFIQYFREVIKLTYKIRILKNV